MCRALGSEPIAKFGKRPVPSAMQYLHRLLDKSIQQLSGTYRPPFADFSRPVRMDRSILSRDFATSERSPEVSPAAIRAQRRIYIQCL